jgi:hypothetical protein
MALGAHARVDQDLRHRVLRRGRLLQLPGAGQVGDEVLRVVVADVLKGIGDGLDEIGLLDGGHGTIILGSVPHDCRWTATTVRGYRMISVRWDLYWLFKQVGIKAL